MKKEPLDYHLYDDIINTPYPYPTARPRMSRLERAAQFAPFAALTGYEECIEEEARLTEIDRELGEGEREELNGVLGKLLEREKEHPLLRVRCFRDDERKQGGSYLTYEASLKRFLPAQQQLLLQNGVTIPLDKIKFIEIL